ncbi:MAG TPA: ATP-dependent DNA helicase RecG [Candidatus Dormibacteraeota bacterium]
MTQTAATAVVVAPGPQTPVERVLGIGPRQAARLARIGVSTVGDLLLLLPRRYEDTRDVRPLRELVPGPQAQTVRARVRSLTTRRSPYKRTVLVEATLEDDGAVAEAIWFNQPFLRNRLHQGDQVVLSGKARLTPSGRLQLQSPVFEADRGDQRHVGRLAPVYPETEGLTSRFLRERIEPLLPAAEQLDDALPPPRRDRQGLLPLAEAVRQIHQPTTVELRDRALERIAFTELFQLQLAAQRARRRRLAGTGAVIPYEPQIARDFVTSLSFRLTDGQRRAAHEILLDLGGPGSMNRLLQGDVGSGKTVVAAMAALMAERAGLQTLVMAPTEILARQHHATLSALLEPHGMGARMLLGATSARARREILAGVASGREALLVGTHALIEEDVAPIRLGLCVVDEQHRFGVAQRQRLRLKATIPPNFLAMTATPIPRSLALTVYGDVDVSELRELPPGRIPVATEVVPPHERSRAYAHVREELRAGRQAFVICPLIEESDKLGVKSATAEYERLGAEDLQGFDIELLHGRMPSREKEARMARFAGGEARVLVSTSVVEVGVDVPNATVMIVEGAERFGLAQLHQFRGRVGRGVHASRCLLFQGSPDEEGSRRLEVVATASSGFDLAELDLRLRGPGDVAGLRQHGLPEMRAADLLDQALLLRARDAAAAWLDEDPELDLHGPLARAMNGYRAVFDLD